MPALTDPTILPITDPWFVISTRNGNEWLICSNGTVIRDEHMELCRCYRKEDATWIKNLLNFQAMHGSPTVKEQ
jgi:hypothetical protein